MVLLNGNWLGISDYTNEVLEGTYSAYIQADAVAPGNSASLSQTGDVPSEAKSLRFTTSRHPPIIFADTPRECWHLHLLLNGKDVPYPAVGVGDSFVRWAADVSSLAGKTSEIRFLVETGYPEHPLRLGMWGWQSR